MLKTLHKLAMQTFRHLLQSSTELRHSFSSAVKVALHYGVIIQDVQSLDYKMGFK